MEREVIICLYSALARKFMTFCFLYVVIFLNATSCLKEHEQIVIRERTFKTIFRMFNLEKYRSYNLISSYN